MSHAADLLASLTSATGDRTSSPEQDLFGSIIDEDEVQKDCPPSNANAFDSNPLSTHLSLPVKQPRAASLLASSGLLGVATSTGGDGLFDEIEEEERRRQEQEEAERKMQEEELQRMEQERHRQQLLEQQQAAMMQQQLQQQQQQQQAAMMMQQQQQAAMMQQQQQAAMMQQQQQQRQNQMQGQMQYMTMQQPGGYGMQSVLLNSSQPVYGQTHGAPPVTPDQGFYREHPPPPQPSSNTYLITQTGGPVQTHVVSRLPVSTMPNITAGMHNTFTTAQPSMTVAISRPPDVEPMYGKVTVTDPLLIQPYSFLNMQPPHWTYQVQTTLLSGGGCWLVRRRFRHVVTLEEKMREECKGAILPPRPDKHMSRAIEEASALQTAEFAMQRCAELEMYLNQLAQHPLASKSGCLRLFLALQDDMGTAWPEVSNNALTRLGAVTTPMTASSLPWDHNPQDMLEDNAELLALASSEGLRMGAVMQAVPKLEGSITLLREYGESAGGVGMELGKLSKHVEGASDRELSVPIEILAGGLLRSSRRQKRLATELAAAMQPFVTQYKLCKNEKLAFMDRRAALIKRSKDRGKADQRAQRLLMQQRSGQGLSMLERDATMSDEMAVDAVAQCNRIGTVLKSEVNRISFERRSEWSKSMKVICSAMKEASSEQVSVWEATKESFLQNYPQYGN